MSPATLRALIGQYLVPNTPGTGPQTARFKVLGFGLHSVRVLATVSDTRSEISIDDLDTALARGDLRVMEK